MTAALSMYDLPEVRRANDDLWRGLARAFRAEGIAETPPRLAHDIAPETLLSDPGLLFAQTCGYPLTHAFAGRFRLIATPCYAAEGCDGPNYSSAVVVREHDSADGLGGLRGRCCAVNSWESHSGMNALRATVAGLARDGRFFGEVVVTGSHTGSIAAVLEGRADVAAVDPVTLALLRRHRPSMAEQLRVVAWTPSAPGLPYVTSASADAERLRRLRAGLRAALDDANLAAARADLLLEDAEVLPDDAYRRITDMEAAAAARGYPRLA